MQNNYQQKTYKKKLYQGITLKTNNPLYIAINNLPCQSEITDLISSKAWSQATKNQKQKLISGIISFNTVLEQYANHYENKKDT